MRATSMSTVALRIFLAGVDLYSVNGPAVGLGSLQSEGWKGF